MYLLCICQNFSASPRKSRKIAIHNKPARWANRFSKLNSTGSTSMRRSRTLNFVSVSSFVPWPSSDTLFTSQASFLSILCMLYKPAQLWQQTNLKRIQSLLLVKMLKFTLPQSQRKRVSPCARSWLFYSLRFLNSLAPTRTLLKSSRSASKRWLLWLHKICDLKTPSSLRCLPWSTSRKKETCSKS